MNDPLANLVRTRARNRCEYCGMPQECDLFPFHIDHIIPIYHRGATIASNLALSCWACNAHKGNQVAGVDPQTFKIVRLYHPRLHLWPYHFVYRDAYLWGKTAMGRATVESLRINLANRCNARTEQIEEGVLFWTTQDGP